MRYYTLQLRSADEGSTVFYSCECGHKYVDIIEYLHDDYAVAFEGHWMADAYTLIDLAPIIEQTLCLSKVLGMLCLSSKSRWNPGIQAAKQAKS